MFRHFLLRSLLPFEIYIYLVYSYAHAYMHFYTYILIQESSAEIEDINKNMAIFKLETELDEQAKSFTATLNAKDAEMDKVYSIICEIATYMYIHTYIELLL